MAVAVELGQVDGGDERAGRSALPVGNLALDVPEHRRIEGVDLLLGQGLAQDNAVLRGVPRRVVVEDRPLLGVDRDGVLIVVGQAVEEGGLAGLL